MRVIICGAGQVGYHIARQLIRENHEVTLIDKDPELIQKINDSLDAKAVLGHASHPSVLDRAGAQDADMLIAVTYSDEVNMIACQVAHTLFNVPSKIARIRHRNYLLEEWKHLYRHDHLPIDVIISPEIEVAEAILRRLHVPGAMDMIPFADDRIRVLAIRCDEDCPLVNLPLSVIESRTEDTPMRILGTVHEDRFTMPRPDLIVSPGDTAYVVTHQKFTRQALTHFGHEEHEARRIIIVGGGNVGLYITQALEREDPHIRIKLIESNKSRAEEIVERLDRAIVIHGSGLDRDILAECGIESTETMIAVTNDDKVNILASLLAKRSGCKHSITLVNNFSYISLLGNLGVDIAVNPRETTVSGILQHVRRGKIRGVHSILDGAAEILEAEAVATSSLVGQPISALQLPKSIQIGALLRGDEFILPRGDTIIQEKDRVVMIATAESIKRVEKFFSVSLEFF